MHLDDSELKLFNTLLYSHIEELEERIAQEKNHVVDGMLRSCLSDAKDIKKKLEDYLW